MGNTNENTQADPTQTKQPPAQAKEKDPPPAEKASQPAEWKAVAGADCSVFVVFGGPRIARCPGSISKVNKDGTVDLEVRLPSGKLEKRERVRHRYLSSQGDGFDAP